MLSERITPGRRWTWVGGKGGVGKTTVAASLAVSLADAGDEVLVLSLDPAHSLADALEQPLGPEPIEVPGVPRLRALEVDAEWERERFLDRHRGALLRLLDEGSYLQRDDAEGLLDLALPGMDELAGVLRLLRLAQDRANLRVVVDTAPTGHTLRLLALPRLAEHWLAALAALEAKRAGVVEALTGVVPEDEATRFLATLRADLRQLSALLRDPDSTRFLLVTTPEPAVLAETRRYRDRLAQEQIALGAIIVNRATDAAVPLESRSDQPVVYIPVLENDPSGRTGLRRFAAAARAGPPETGGRFAGVSERGVTVHGPAQVPGDRRLYLVGGKGGVGKTTIASALAVQLAQTFSHRALLLSTDPAGSLGELFGVAVGGEPVAAPGLPTLSLQQVNADRAWAAFRAEFHTDVEALFAGLLRKGLSVEADRRVVEAVIDLVPPGIDELMALLDVVDLSEAGAYNSLVLDTAPTGHLLRLLEMPTVALGWTHRVLRLLLDYRELIGLGPMAERLLRFSRSLRTLRERLADPAHTLIGVVALPESLSIPETERLLARLERIGLRSEVLWVNRLLTLDGEVVGGRGALARALLETHGAPAAVGAPEWPSELCGAGELLRFADGWRHLQIE